MMIMIEDNLLTIRLGDYLAAVAIYYTGVIFQIEISTPTICLSISMHRLHSVGSHLKWQVQI